MFGVRLWRPNRLLPVILGAWVADLTQVGLYGEAECLLQSTL
jgi:hypothetical protein